MNREARGKTVLEPKNDVGESANNQQTYLTFVPEKQSKKRGRAALRNEEDENITWRLRLRIHPWSLKRFNYSRVYIFENELELRCYHSSFVARSEQLLVNTETLWKFAGGTRSCQKHSRQQLQNNFWRDESLEGKIFRWAWRTSLWHSTHLSFTEDLAPEYSRRE